MCDCSIAQVQNGAMSMWQYPLVWDSDPLGVGSKVSEGQQSPALRGRSAIASSNPRLLYRSCVVNHKVIAHGQRGPDPHAPTRCTRAGLDRRTVSQRVKPIGWTETAVILGRRLAPSCLGCMRCRHWSYAGPARDKQPAATRIYVSGWPVTSDKKINHPRQMPQIVSRKQSTRNKADSFITRHCSPSYEVETKAGQAKQWARGSYACRLSPGLRQRSAQKEHIRKSRLVYNQDICRLETVHSCCSLFASDNPQGIAPSKYPRQSSAPCSRSITQCQDFNLPEAGKPQEIACHQ